jgi:hypothetical protein
MGAGTVNTAALAFGGFNGLDQVLKTVGTESWNGTNWTEVNDLNTARRSWIRKWNKHFCTFIIGGYSGGWT